MTLTHPVMKLLTEHPVMDGHNDLPWELRQHDYDLTRVDLLADQSALFQTDLLRARAGGLGAQFWSVWVPGSYAGERAVTATLEQIDCVHEMVRHYPEHLQLATTATEVEEAMSAGRLASLIGVEGAHQLAGSLGVLRTYHQLGARYLTLSHTANNPFCDSATDAPEHGGLSGLGRALVAELNRLGMLIDLSHVSPDTMRQTLDLTTAPVIFSHSSAHALCPSPRNVPDDVLDRVPGNGGVVMAVFAPFFTTVESMKHEDAWAQVVKDTGVGSDRAARRALRESWLAEHPAPVVTVKDVADHLDYLKERVGAGHIGLGGDFDGIDAGPTGLEDVSGYPTLLAELHDRGWTEDELAGLACRNILRVLRQVTEPGHRA